MICYRDRTFCPFYETCDKRNNCSRPLTPQVKAAAANWWGSDDVPISMFVEKPECHSDNDHIADTSKKINDACEIAYHAHLENGDGLCWSRLDCYRAAWQDALAWKAMAEEENCNEPTSLNFSMEIRLERHDEIPAFGAFLRCEEQHDKSPVIYLNVQTCMIPELENETGAVISMSRDDRKRLIIESLMHEFGHALESHFRIPVNEDAIESACIAWERAYALGREGGEKL